MFETVLTGLQVSIIEIEIFSTHDIQNTNEIGGREFFPNSLATQTFVDDIHKPLHDD